MYWVRARLIDRVHPATARTPDASGRRIAARLRALSPAHPPDCTRRHAPGQRKVEGTPTRAPLTVRMRSRWHAACRPWSINRLVAELIMDRLCRSQVQGLPTPHVSYHHAQKCASNVAATRRKTRNCWGAQPPADGISARRDLVRHSPTPLFASRWAGHVPASPRWSATRVYPHLHRRHDQLINDHLINDQRITRLLTTASLPSAYLRPHSHWTLPRQ